MSTASAGWLPQKVVIRAPKWPGFSFELRIYNTLPGLCWLFNRDPYKLTGYNPRLPKNFLSMPSETNEPQKKTALFSIILVVLIGILIS